MCLKMILCIFLFYLSQKRPVPNFTLFVINDVNSNKGFTFFFFTVRLMEQSLVIINISITFLQVTTSHNKLFTPAYVPHTTPPKLAFQTEYHFIPSRIYKAKNMSFTLLKLFCTNMSLTWKCCGCEGET